MTFLPDEPVFVYALRSTLPLTLFPGPGNMPAIMPTAGATVVQGLDRLLTLARLQQGQVQDVRASGASQSTGAHVALELMKMPDPPRRPEADANVRAVRAIHRPVPVDVVAWDCAQHDCAHQDTCPKTRLDTCAECYRIAVDDPNDPDRVETTVPPEWPCPTAAALGITKER